MIINESLIIIIIIIYNYKKEIEYNKKCLKKKIIKTNLKKLKAQRLI